MAQQFHCVSLCVFQTPVASRRASEISNHARHSTLQIARASMRVSVEFSLRFRRFSSLDYGALRNFNPKQRALTTVSCFFSDGFPYFKPHSRRNGDLLLATCKHTVFRALLRTSLCHPQTHVTVVYCCIPLRVNSFTSYASYAICVAELVS